MQESKGKISGRKTSDRGKESGKLKVSRADRTA